MLNDRAKEIRQIIHEYIHSRLLTKIDKLDPEDPKYQAEQDKHVPEVWLSSAVERAIQIQVVTHPLKATYPNAHIRKTTSLYCRPTELPQHQFIATQVLGNEFIDDVTGNAAALDVYGLLQETVGDVTLLELCLNGDKDLKAALHDKPEVAQKWLADLAYVTQSKMEGVASHVLAKQLYWLADNDPYSNDDYVLVSPLYSSTLAHEMFEKINHDRFSDEAKEIRDAARQNKPHNGIARSYPNLAIQVIGGANPQGISSLSSRRRGVNYLLPSLPPNWQQQEQRPLFYADSAFTIFGKRRDTREWVEQLQIFLASNPPANVSTRRRIDNLVSGLLDELYIFADAYQHIEPGWSADELCHLPQAQCYWLDPARALQDAEFAEQWLNSDWDTTIEHDFSRWLNSQLGKQISHLGDVEFHRWAKAMRRDSYWANYVSEQLATAYSTTEKRE